MPATSPTVLVVVTVVDPAVVAQPVNDTPVPGSMTQFVMARPGGAWATRVSAAPLSAVAELITKVVPSLFTLVTTSPLGMLTPVMVMPGERPAVLAQAMVVLAAVVALPILRVLPTAAGAEAVITKWVESGIKAIVAPLGMLVPVTNAPTINPVVGVERATVIVPSVEAFVRV